MSLEKILSHIKKRIAYAVLVCTVGCGDADFKESSVADAQLTSQGNIVYLTHRNARDFILYTDIRGKKISSFEHFLAEKASTVVSVRPLADGCFLCAGTIEELRTGAKWVHNDKVIGDEQVRIPEFVGFLTKIDQEGNIVWHQEYKSEKPYTGPAGFPRPGDLSDIVFEDMTVLPDGHIVLVGEKGISGCILKVDEAGEQQWVNVLAPEYKVSRISKVCGPHNNLIAFLGTNRYAKNTLSDDSLILGFFDKDGIISWTRQLEVQDKNEDLAGDYKNCYEPVSLERTSDGEYIFSGRTDSPFSIRRNPFTEEKDKRDEEQKVSFVMKTDAIGNLQWKRGISWYIGDSMPTPDNGCVVVGVQKNEEGKRLITALKMDQEGQTEWQTTYRNAHFSNEANSVVVLDNGYTVAACYKGRLSLLRLNRNGNFD